MQHRRRHGISAFPSLAPGSVTEPAAAGGMVHGDAVLLHPETATSCCITGLLYSRLCSSFLKNFTTISMFSFKRRLTTSLLQKGFLLFAANSTFCPVGKK